MIDEGEGDATTDAVIQVNGVKLLVDPISARYLRGAEVDFVDNVTGGGFTIKNPNAKSTCGCGSSVNVLSSVTREKKDKGGKGLTPQEPPPISTPPAPPAA